MDGFMSSAKGSFKLEKKTNYYGICMLICAGFFFALHMTFVGFTNDEVYFQYLRGLYDSLFELVKYRYETDSSRVISEWILFFLIDKPFIIWQIADTLICVLVFHCMSIMLINDRYSAVNIPLLMAVASYPFMHMGSAGWICTSLNYLWPMATLLYMLTGVYRRYRAEEIRPWQYCLYICAGIFTANCEMSATMILLTFGMALAIAIYNKRNVAYELIGCIIGLAGIIFAFSTPGNGERTAMEAANWMPEFFDLTIVDKFRLCTVFVFEHFVAIPDVLFFLFALLIAVRGIARKNSLFKNICAAMPLVIDVVFTGIYFVKDFIIGHKKNYDFTTPAIFMKSAEEVVVQLSELAGIILFIVCAVITIWNIFDDNVRKVTAIWAMGAGFAVREALMLSPTMFSSWHRTLIFLYFGFIYNIVLLLPGEPKKWTKRLIYGILICGILVNLILTVGLQIRKSSM